MVVRRNERFYKSWRNNLHDRRSFRDVKKINEQCDCSYPSYNRENRIRRIRNRSKNKLNIPKLVYKFLGNVASFENEEENDRAAHSTLTRGGVKKSKKQKHHPNAVHVAIKNVDESRTSVSTSKTTETNSTSCEPPSTPGSTTNSGIRTEQKFSIQAIKDYIKAGIAEGKRRAKKYICKALSFGVDTGYLIPTDSDGQVLRVSSALINFTPQKDGEKNGERRIRKKLRRGEMKCTSEERKLLRRREAPAAPKKRPRSQSSTPSSASSSKRTTRPKVKKPKYGKRIKKRKTRSSKKVKLKRGPGRPRTRIGSRNKKEQFCPGIKSANLVSNENEENFQDEKLTSSRYEKDNTKSIKKGNVSDPPIGRENKSSKEIQKIRKQQ